MVPGDQVIIIENIEQIEQYKLKFLFNDNTEQCVDFHPFLSASLNPLIRKYLDPNEFSKYTLDKGDLQWNDYDLCFPIADLYDNRIIH